MMPRGFGILLILLLATLPSFLCAALNDKTKTTKGSEATYRTVSYLVERELSSSSSVSSTQSGPEDTTLDDSQTEIYYWKKKALQYKKEKLQYKKEKLQYKKDKLQYRYQKESMEQKKENHKLKAGKILTKRPKADTRQLPGYKEYDFSGDTDKIVKLGIGCIRNSWKDEWDLDRGATTNFGIGYGMQCLHFEDCDLNYKIHLE
eukprot:693724_1